MGQSFGHTSIDMACAASYKTQNLSKPFHLCGEFWTAG